jgi:putative NIF3 family GTP cyclohydrolase 1 type 2
MIKIKEIIKYLEEKVPLEFQESYDNCGLITGNSEDEIKGVLICLDSTEAVVEEAIRLGVNLIIAHHPIIFSGLKKLQGEIMLRELSYRQLKMILPFMQCIRISIIFKPE